MFSQQTEDTQRERTSPVFVGREEELELALRRWNTATTGSGGVLLVAGEAGIGKTRLLAELVSNIDDRRHLSAKVFARDVETVGGLILDVSAALSRTSAAATATALRDRLTTDAGSQNDPSRNRRILIGDLASIATNLLAEQPTLLCIEDLHWSDELSLDVLERIATTMSTTNSLVIATYRSDELYPRTPLRRLRTRLLEQRLAEEIRLTRLDAAQTSTLIRSIAGDDQSSEMVSRVFDRSDGIPLFVEELIADGCSGVPETIADSIGFQVAALSEPTIPVLEAAAVIGRSFDVDLLESVAGTTRDIVDAALQELAARNLVLPGADGSSLDFRHALIRDVVYENIAPLRKRDLHAAVAASAVSAGFSESFLSDQFERARQPAEAYAHALAAARAACCVSAHREAVELFRRAQRTAPSSVSPIERAQLYSELAVVLAATDDNKAAAAQLTTAVEIYRSAGDEISAARLIPRLSAVRHLIGADYYEREAFLDGEIERVDRLDPPAPAAVRASLLSSLAAVYMLDRCLDDAMEVGLRAAALAEEANAVDEQIEIEMTTGSVLLFAGPGNDGWSRLEASITKARKLQYETQAARGYRMIGSAASVLVEYPRARQAISDGLDYSCATEHWNDFHYLNAHRAHVLWATGEWDEAQAIAAKALDEGRGGITTRNTALTVLGYLALGRGDFADARRYLGEAREIGERMRELQRLLPALWGLAETDLLEGNLAGAIATAELAYSQSEPIGDAAYIFPFLATGVRAYLAKRETAKARDWFDRVIYLLRYRSIPGTMPAIAHAEGLILLAEGQTGAARTLLEEAAAQWDTRERFWEGARAAIDLAHCAARSRRPRDAARLLETARQSATAAGATTLLALADQVAGDDESTSPLSAREIEVARLVATGATNREIAESLVISPKTASSHIEHILAKLGVARRTEIAAWVIRQAD